MLWQAFQKSEFKAQGLSLYNLIRLAIKEGSNVVVLAVIHVRDDLLRACDWLEGCLDYLDYLGKGQNSSL